MEYTVNARIRANGIFFEKGEIFPQDLPKVDYGELLTNGLILREAKVVKEPKVKKPRRVVSPVHESTQSEIEQTQLETENL